jgi:hypothetical protein
VKKIKIKELADVLFEGNYINVDEYHRIDKAIIAKRFNAAIGVLHANGISVDINKFSIAGDNKLTEDSEIIIPGISSKKYINNIRQ